MVAAEKMYINEFTLKEGDIGFKEISELVKSELRTALGNPIPEDKLSALKITQLKTLKSGLHQILTPIPPRVEDFIELQVSFQNLQPATGDFRNIKGKIKEKYLSNTLIQWKIIIFGAGILLMVISRHFQYLLMSIVPWSVL